MGGDISRPIKLREVNHISLNTVEIQSHKQLTKCVWKERKFSVCVIVTEFLTTCPCVCTLLSATNYIVTR